MACTIISKRPTNIEIVEQEFNESRGEYVKIRSVTIMGGAGLLNPKTFATPEGVATEITDEAYEWLKNQPKFIKGLETGVFRAIEHTKARTVDADEIASSGDMEKNENIPGRPLTPNQLEKAGAVVKKDGTIDITEGGKSAPNDQTIHLDNVRREKKIAKRGKRKA